MSCEIKTILINVVHSFIASNIKCYFLYKDYDHLCRKQIHKDEIHIGQIKSTQKIHVNVGLCQIHAHNFGGHGLSGFGDIATFKNSQFSLSDHGL